MANIRKCFLHCLQQSHEPINLPHNKSIIVGRNLFSGIKDVALSRNQLKLIANVQLCTVELTPLGINPTGVNGFVLNRNVQYTLRHKDILELLLNKYFYEIRFHPEPEQINTEKDKTLSSKRKANDESEPHITKQLKCDITTLKKNVVGWEEIDSKKLYIYTSNNVISKAKVAAYDLDGTIITTKSGARFPKDSEDWKFAFPEVKNKILDLHKNDFKVVIFTNQAGIGLGKVKIGDFRSKVEKIVNQLNVPVQVFVSTGKGIYRKPAPGMWDAFTEQKNNNISIDLAESFYCGDAAGREKNWAPKMKKDHSIADRLFALNIGLNFQTPEEHFLGARKIGGTMPQFDPRNLKPMPLLIPANSQLTTKQQEVVIFVGSPGSGKSNICTNHLVPQGYIHINRDKLGSWQKCVSALDVAVQKKQSVVIDNTNPDKESRKRFVEIAKKYKIPCRCFVMNTDIFQAKHNNVFREMIDKDHLIVGDIVINSYKNKFQEPSLDEGFTEIVKINCNPTFSNPEHERLYHMFLLDKLNKRYLIIMQIKPLNKWVTGHASDPTIVISITCHLNVPTISPSVSPGVFNNPEILVVFGAVTYNQNSVIELILAAVLLVVNTVVIELERILTGINSNRNRPHGCYRLLQFGFISKWQVYVACIGSTRCFWIVSTFPIFHMVRI